MGMCHHAQLIFLFKINVLEMGCQYVAQTGLELLASSSPLALTCESTGITGVGHCLAILLLFQCMCPKNKNIPYS